MNQLKFLLLSLALSTTACSTLDDRSFAFPQLNKANFNKVHLGDSPEKVKALFSSRPYMLEARYNVWDRLTYTRGQMPYNGDFIFYYRANSASFKPTKAVFLFDKQQRLIKKAWVQ
jgi:hypothetical protein